MRAQFIRGGQDPIASLRIGLRTKRHFKSDEEIVQWLYDFPDVCTDGYIKKWERAHQQKRKPVEGASPFPPYIMVPSDLRLEVIKWIKRNLMWEGDFDIGLKEAKDLGDKLAQMIHDKAE